MANGSGRRRHRATPRPKGAAPGRADQIRSISAQIRESYTELPAQIQVAARFVLDHPQDVALLSMREQSRRAGVPAVTMNRLAGLLGFAGFDELRAIYVDAIREAIDPFSSRAEGLVLRYRQLGEPGIGSAMVHKLSGSITDLELVRQKEALLSAARLLSACRKVYCLGQRSAFGVAYHFAYLYGFFSDKPSLLDAPGGVGFDRLAHAGPEDGVLVISMEPCARKSIEIARFARSRGLKLVAITNSELSPVGRIADVSILVDPQSPSFFDAMTSSFAACEVLVALIAGLAGENVPDAVRRTEQHGRALATWWSDDDDREPRKRLRGRRSATKPRIPS